MKDFDIYDLIFIGFGAFMIALVATAFGIPATIIYKNYKAEKELYKLEENIRIEKESQLTPEQYFLLKEKEAERELELKKARISACSARRREEQETEREKIRAREKRRIRRSKPAYNLNRSGIVR